MLFPHVFSRRVGKRTFSFILHRRIQSLILDCHCEKSHELLKTLENIYFLGVPGIGMNKVPKYSFMFFFLCHFGYCDENKLFVADLECLNTLIKI